MIERDATFPPTVGTAPDVALSVAALATHVMVPPVCVGPQRWEPPPSLPAAGSPRLPARSGAVRLDVQPARASTRRRSTKASSAATGTRRSLPSLIVSSSPELMSSYTNVRPHPSCSATSCTVSSSARARIGRSCEARTDVTERRRTSAFSRTGGSSKNNSDCAMYELYIASAYRLLTTFRDHWYAFGRNGILDPMRSISRHGNCRRILHVFVLLTIVAR